MFDRPDVRQLPNQIVDTADWLAFEDYEVYPVGARDKSLRLCPDPPPYTFCLPGHKYLFKEAIKSVRNPQEPRHPDQYWAEAIAFQIGRLMKVPVPPTFIAMNSLTGEPGTLIEWFIGYDSTVEERFTSGGDHMQAMIDEYDRDKGRQHNLATIITLCRSLSGSLSGNRILVDRWQEYWGLCLCFDALIGNTDRHQENWGLIWNDETRAARLSPFFDNGTSLGHELFPTKIAHYMNDKSSLLRYIMRGRHQMKWRQQDEHRMPLIEGVLLYCKKYPRVVPLLKDRLNWDEGRLQEILSLFTAFDIQSPLTAERAEFVQELTVLRKRLLLDHLGKLG